MNLTRRNLLLGTAAIVAGAALPSFPKTDETGYVFSYFIKDAGAPWRRVVKRVGEAEARYLIESDPLDTAGSLVRMAQLEEIAPPPSQYVEIAQTNLLRHTT